MQRSTNLYISEQQLMVEVGRGLDGNLPPPALVIGGVPFHLVQQRMEEPIYHSIDSEHYSDLSSLGSSLSSSGNSGRAAREVEEQQQQQIQQQQHRPMSSAVSMTTNNQVTENTVSHALSTNPFNTSTTNTAQGANKGENVGKEMYEEFNSSIKGLLQDSAAVL